MCLSGSVKSMAAKCISSHKWTKSNEGDGYHDMKKRVNKKLIHSSLHLCFFHEAVITN